MSPGTLQVINIWKSKPISFPSTQWRIARIRLVADLLLKSSVLQLQDHQELVAATLEELNKARCWIYQRPDGTYARYRSLAQPWCTKEIPWPYDEQKTKLADQSKALKSLLIASIATGTNAVRISTEHFNELIAENNGGFKLGVYDDRGSMSMDHPKFEWFHDKYEGPEENAFDDGQRDGGIKDWLELALHTTAGNEEGC
ncbi:MAG: hypothetical protein Q9213_003652 [Squamulea squamosa]